MRNINVLSGEHDARASEEPLRLALARHHNSAERREEEKYVVSGIDRNTFVTAMQLHQIMETVARVRSVRSAAKCSRALCC